MIDSSINYFFSLLSAFLKNTKPPVPININWNYILELSQIHFVSGAVYTVIQKLETKDKPEADILNKFKSDFFNTILRFEEQEKVYREVTKELNEFKIPHIFFKGAVIREYYPIKEMRTLGDMDFLLHESDQERTKHVLERIGYENTANIGHWKYSKGKVILEAHDKLMYSQINESADYSSYFEGAWENSKNNNDEFTYEMKLEYHLIFILTHIAKHFYNYGAGVRMILDVAVILNKFGQNLDYEYVWGELAKLKLDLFTKNIFGLCVNWFQVTIPDRYVNYQVHETIEAYIIEGGTFGFNNRNFAIHIIRKELEKTEHIKSAQFKAFWKKIFLDYKTIINLYPILEKLPFLLPFAWIARGYTCIRERPHRTMSILKGIFSKAEEAKDSHNVLKHVGL